MGSNPKVLRSSVADGIAITPRYRERQLTALHKSLSGARSELLLALKKDSGFTQAEATAEYLLTLNAIKSFHSTCNPVSCNEEEYAIANSKDYKTRRVPYGYAYIVPVDTGSLYSTVVPVAAAIAAGNVVLLEQSKRPGLVSVELQALLTKALSQETFSYVDKDPMGLQYQQTRGITFEARSASNASTTSKRISCPSLRVAAVVDRSGDTKAAARDLVQARFGFGGSSSYAPDLVLVNEFKIKEFSKAVAEAGVQYLSQTLDGSSKGGKSKANGILDGAAPEHQATTIVSGDKGKIIVLESRDSALLSQKISTPVLRILSVSSMDDAIDLLNAGEAPLLANYVYATPDVGKYMSQFVRSAASFVNHIPTELSIGGPAPSGFACSPHPRYTTDMFSVPSPALIHDSSLSQAIAKLVSSTAGKQQRSAEDALDSSLTPYKEPFGPAIGFFEQGFLFNASFILGGIIIGTFCGIKYGYPAVVLALQR